MWITRSVVIGVHQMSLVGVDGGGALWTELDFVRIMQSEWINWCHQLVDTLGCASYHHSYNVARQCERIDYDNFARATILITPEMSIAITSTSNTFNIEHQPASNKSAFVYIFFPPPSSSSPEASSHPSLYILWSLLSAIIKHIRQQLTTTTTTTTTINLALTARR